MFIVEFSDWLANTAISQYFQVTLWALIPSILYYVACFGAVHFEAKRDGLKGLSAAETPRLGDVMRARGHLFGRAGADHTLEMAPAARIREVVPRSAKAPEQSAPRPS